MVSEDLPACPVRIFSSTGDLSDRAWLCRSRHCGDAVLLRGKQCRELWPGRRRACGLFGGKRGTCVKKNGESARPPQLTGGEGFTYEDVIAAYFLAALLREEAALAQPGLVTRVAVQQDRQGEPMDDVIVDSDAVGERNRLSLQVKRSVTVSASNADFKKIVTKAVE